MLSARLLILLLWISLGDNGTANAFAPSQSSCGWLQHHRLETANRRVPASKSLNEKEDNTKEIYGIPGSGWTSPTWNWGYAQGTGHDCALICRQKYATTPQRQALIDRLLDVTDEDETTWINIEELKLILGLAFQKGRWDGSDGGREGYGQVLAAMTQAQRYEQDSDARSHQLLLEDMADRFPLLLSNEEDERCERMNEYARLHNPTVGLQKASGLVLQTMGFVQKGL